MHRILFVLGTGYLPGTITGANVSLHALCSRLIGAGYDPIVVCTADPPSSSPAAGDSLEVPYPVLRLADPVEAMKEMIGRIAPTAVVVRGAPTAARLALWPRALELRIHVLLPSSVLGFGFPVRGAAPLWRYAAVSRFDASLAGAYLGCRVELVPSIVEPEAYRCTPTGDAILFVNPTPAKGAYIVAAIAERLAHRRFLVVRAWPEWPSHPHVPIDLPNVERIDSAFDMRPVYARARIVLVPSVVEESSGRVAQEAQISGIPVIASDRGGLPETVGPGGIVVPLATPVAQWCATIETLYADSARYAQLSRHAEHHAARPDASPAHALARFIAFVEP